MINCDRRITVKKDDVWYPISKGEYSWRNELGERVLQRLRLPLSWSRSGCAQQMKAVEFIGLLGQS